MILVGAMERPMPCLIFLVALALHRIILIADKGHYYSIDR